MDQEIVRSNPGFAKARDEGMEVVQVMAQIQKIEIGDVKITFFGAKGEPLKPGELARLHRWQIEGPGIDPNRVASVQIPKLDYRENGILTLMVEMYPVDLLAAAEPKAKPAS
jgi:hypothetical protein